MGGVHNFEANISDNTLVSNVLCNHDSQKGILWCHYGHFRAAFIYFREINNTLIPHRHSKEHPHSYYCIKMQFKLRLNMEIQLIVRATAILFISWCKND